MELPKLNFEAHFDFKITKNKDTFFIYDIIRKQDLVLTPEEWVRQHWVHYFHFVKKRNFSSIIIEQKIELNGTTKRLDLLITEKTQPKILIECKAPHIPITEAVFEQVARYNAVILAPEIILSNGLQHIYAQFENGKYKFVMKELKNEAIKKCSF